NAVERAWAVKPLQGLAPLPPGEPFPQRREARGGAVLQDPRGVRAQDGSARDRQLVDGEGLGGGYPTREVDRNEVGHGTSLYPSVRHEPPPPPPRPRDTRAVPRRYDRVASAGSAGVACATVVRSDAETRRLIEARERGVAWRKCRPYLGERQWGTVREGWTGLVAKLLQLFG